MSRVLHSTLARQLSQRAGMRFFRLFCRPLEPRRGGESAGLRVRLLTEQELLEHGRDPQLDLRPDAVAAAHARGDLCAAAFDADILAGYCWFAFAPLPHLDGVWVRFAGSVAWVYKSLVLPTHRGRGIAPALYRFCDVEGRERGRGYSLICVESHNRPSVSAALRAGYAAAGYGGYLVRGSHLFTWSSPAARAHGVSFFLPEPGSVEQA